LVACTATLGLGAAQSAQDDSQSKLRPIDLQLGASIVGYDSKDAWGTDGTTTTFSPKGAGFAPSFRFSFEPVALPFGGLAFTFGYRMGNDVPLEYESPIGTRDGRADLQHKSQISIGALLRGGVTENFDFGLGLETRNDWMYASELRGSETEHTVWRPWLRINGRYLFDRGTNVTPFVGVEAGFALSAVDTHPLNYYHDYAMNTGDAYLGDIDTSVVSPESFAKGHMPIWEAAVVAGLRFGRHSPCGSAPVQKPKSVAPPPEKPVEAPPPQVEVAPPPVEEAVAPPVVDAAPPPPAEVVAPPVIEQVQEQAVPEAKTELQIIEIEGLRMHFVTNDATSEANNRAAVRNWAAKYKKIVDPKTLMVTGHCDKRGSEAHNRALSTRRANTLAGYLRAEGVNVPAANVKGRSWDEPIADNDTPEGLAKNRRAEITVTGPKYKIVSVLEGNVIGIN
jgi:outer membrane protein OmpA-like peptidoglycan-associated protein